MSRKVLTLGVFLTLLTVTTGTLAQSTPKNLGDLKLRLVAYHRSGAYERDIAVVVAKAQKFVEKRARQVKNPALVLDIDETALSNWPQLLANDFGYIPGGTCEALPAGPCGVKSWELSGRAEAITPTLALFNVARSLNVAVFFVSGRPENERAATEENLRHVGYDHWAGLALRPAGDAAPVAVFKTAERRKIADEGYTIIANIGDQPSDLAGGYAERIFLLPDPFYRIP